MSYRNDEDMYTAMDESKKNVATSYENNELSSASMPMYSVVSAKPPPPESTYDTLNHSTNADSPTSKSLIKNPIKFRLTHVIFLTIAVVMMAALVIPSFVAIVENSALKQQLSGSNAVLPQLNESNIMLQKQLTTLHNQTRELNDSNTMLQRKLMTLHNQTQQLSDSNTMLQQLLDTALFAGQLCYPFTLQPPVLLCLRPPPRTTIGSRPPTALL